MARRFWTQARIAELKVRWPSPGLQSRDPRRLRYAVLALLVAGFAWAGSDWGKRLALAFTPDSGAAALFTSS